MPLLASENSIFESNIAFTEGRFLANTDLKMVLINPVCQSFTSKCNCVIN